MASSQAHISYEDYHIPVNLFREFRNSIRFSIVKKGLNVRYPLYYNKNDLLEKAKMWCVEVGQKKPGAIAIFKIKDYTNLSSLHVFGEEYKLEIKPHKLPKDIISWKGNTVTIKVHHLYTSIQQSEIIKQLLSKFIARRFLGPVASLVNEINDRIFNVPIGNVRLKNNHSNWGSCSNKGNINLSTRLLLAPRDIIEYVIIHELAHRKEMNHSSKFWKIVEQACPNYKSKEKWLKLNSHLCHF